MMFPGYLVVYHQVLELKVCCYERDSSPGNDKDYCSRGRASTMRLPFLKWSDIPAIAKSRW